MSVFFEGVQRVRREEREGIFPSRSSTQDVVGCWRVGDSHLGAKDECAKSMWPGGNTTESWSLFTCDSTSRLQ